MFWDGKNDMTEEDGWTSQRKGEGFLGGTVVKNLPANAGDASSIPGLGRFPGVGNGNSLQYSCLENSMDKEAWRATVPGVARVRHDWVRGSARARAHTHTHTHTHTPQDEQNSPDILGKGASMCQITEAWRKWWAWEKWEKDGYCWTTGSGIWEVIRNEAEKKGA